MLSITSGFSSKTTQVRLIHLRYKLSILLHAHKINKDIKY